MNELDRWVTLGLCALIILGTALASWRHRKLGGRDESGWPVERSDWLILALPLGWFVLPLATGLGAEAVERPKPAESQVIIGLLMDTVVKGGLLFCVLARLFGTEAGVSRWLGMRPESRTLVRGLGLGVGLVVLTFLTQGSSVQLLSELGFEPELQSQVQLLLDGAGLQVMIAMTLAAVVVAPVVEEIVFRGYLYPLLRDVVGIWPAILLSSLLFALVHGNLTVIPALSVLAVGLCWLFERTRTIWVPIAIHALFNGTTMAFLWIQWAS